MVISYIAGRFFTTWATQGKPKNTAVGGLILSLADFPDPRNRTRISCIAGGFFTSWAIRETKTTYEGKDYHHDLRFSSVQFNCSVMSNSLQPHESQHARPPCPSPTPGVHSNSCPSSQWCHPAISSSVLHFTSCPQSLPASESFPMSQLFSWGGQSIGVSASASVLPMNT